jgi:ribosome recycling factor
VKFADIEGHMQKAVESTQKSFNTIRTGRASTSLLDRVSIDYYGSPTPLKSLANINTPDGSTISIQPFDKSSLGAIEKAISLSDIGLTPSNDGIAIRLNIPPLTTERRKELVKQAAKYSEEGKVSVRNIRRDGIDEVKKQEKSSEISEDESKNLQDKIQKLTDRYVANIEKVLADKQKDIMTV